MSSLRPSCTTQRNTKNQKNERHAAWEHSGAKRNERHATWERFLKIHGPDWSPKMGPPQTAQIVYFKLFWTLFGCQACPGPNRGITTQDLPTLHGNAISSNKMNATLHGSADAEVTPKSRQGFPRPLRGFRNVSRHSSAQTS